MNQVTKTMEDSINDRIDKDVAGGTQVSTLVHGLQFENTAQIMEFSKLMAVSRQAVPKHLREQPGMCMAVTVQALGWGMEPFTVANKSYVVNDRIAYEAQLVQAVIEQRAPIKGRIRGGFEGEGAARVCVLECTSAEDGLIIKYRSPEIGKITTKNSPLWRSDPDQQLWYYSARAMCRRHFPDVLLGVYAKDEVADNEEPRDVTPEATGRKTLAQSLREQVEKPDQPEESDDQTIDGTAVHWTNEIPFEAAFPGSPEFNEGRKAHEAGAAYTDCPHEDDPDKAVDWCGGWAEREKEVTQ